MEQITSPFQSEINESTEQGSVTELKRPDLARARYQLEPDADLMGAIEYPWIRESKFRELYLADLVNLSTMDEEAAQAALARWLEIAVYPTLRVNVRADNSDEVLYWVPPIRPTYKSNQHTDHLRHLRQAMVEGSQIPARGNKRYYEHVHGHVVASEPTQEEINQWLLILKRYNMVPDSATTLPQGALISTTYDDDDW